MERLLRIMRKILETARLVQLAESLALSHQMWKLGCGQSTTNTQQRRFLQNV